MRKTHRRSRAGRRARTASAFEFVVDIDHVRRSFGLRNDYEPPVATNTAGFAAGIFAPGKAASPNSTHRNPTARNSASVAFARFVCCRQNGRVAVDSRNRMVDDEHNPVWKSVPRQEQKGFPLTLERDAFVWFRAVQKGRAPSRNSSDNADREAFAPLETMWSSLSHPATAPQIYKAALSRWRKRSRATAAMMMAPVTI